MAKLALEHAPPTAVPRRFLLTAPLWGAVAGALLMLDAQTAISSRWGPATLALVHVFTLGVLGNAMFGSLLQFLPAAVGAHVAGGRIAAWTMHALLNLGTVLLVAGLRLSHPVNLTAAGVVLAAAFALLAAMTLPGLVRAPRQRLLRAGIGTAVIGALVTASLGLALLLELLGYHGLPLQPWVDVHAAWGVAGWAMVLLASVAQVVMPMFQGAARMPDKAQASWLVIVVVLMVAGTFAATREPSSAALLLRLAVAAGVGGFAAAALWLQGRAPRARNVWLTHAWRSGLLCLLAAAGVMAAEGPATVAGVLAVAVGLPLLVVGMQIEIVAFLGWIELHRRVGRGVHLPSVQRLLPDADRKPALLLHWSAASTLVGAALWPHPAIARCAGALLVLANAVLWWTLQGPTRRGDAFCSARREGLA